MSVRFGVVGTGNIGARHARSLLAGEVTGAELTGVVCRSGSSAFGVDEFDTCAAMLASHCVDAVIVATPTHSHVELGAQILDAGLHLVMEKPLGRSIAVARDLVARAGQDQIFAVMLNQRFHPAYATLKSLLDGGAIGKLQRVSWIMTAWYRPDVYFRVSRWRGTWPGEGGGLLVNQCIHNIDALQWLVGMPATVRAFAGFGRYHDIDVEDEVTAYLEYDDGATGVLVASTGEAPGSNRLEVVGDLGTLTFDGERIEHKAASERVAEHCANTFDVFGSPSFATRDVPIPAADDQHATLLCNVVDAIERRAPLRTPAAQGLNSLELANAMLLSAWTDRAVRLPLDGKVYEAALQDKIASSSPRVEMSKEELQQVRTDIEQSFR